MLTSSPHYRVTGSTLLAVDTFVASALSTAALVVFAVLAMATLAMATPASAQDSSRAAHASSTPALAPGDWVRVTTKDGTDFHGRLIRADEESLTVADTGEGERVVGRDEIDEIRIRESKVASFAKGGALIGGLGMGLTSAYVINGICDGSTDCSGDAGLAVVLGAALGVAAGSIVGALVGAAASDWRTVAPDASGSAPSPVRLDVGLAQALAGGEPSVGLSVAIPLPR